jgi:hypothetical protein
MQILSYQNLVKIFYEHVYGNYQTVIIIAIILFIMTFSILIILNTQFHIDLKILSLTYFIPLLGFFILKIIQSLITINSE